MLSQPFRRRQGSMTVLFIVIIMPVLSLFIIGLAGISRQTNQVQLTRAMRSQLQVTLAGYDRQLYEEYALIAFDPAIVNLAILNELTPADLYCVQTITGQDDLFNTDMLTSQITRIMLPRLGLRGVLGIEQLLSKGTALNNLEIGPLDLDVKEAVEQLKGSDVSASDDQQNQLITTLIKLLAKKFEPDIERQLSDLMSELDGGMDLRKASASSLIALADRFRQAIESPVLQQILLSEYTLSYLTRPCEIDCVVTGMPPNLAPIAFKGELTALRGAIRLAELSADAKRMASIRASAAAGSALIAGATGGTVLIDPELLTQFLIIGQALRQAVTDVDRLAKGEEIPILPDSILGKAIPDILKTLGVFRGAYEDYQRIFLLLVPAQLLKTRIRDQIKGRVLGQRMTRANLDVSVSIPAFFRLPGLSDQVSMSLAYAR